MQRLKLIWFALTAPKAAIERRVDEAQSGWDWAINNDYLKELDSLKVGTWDLVGVSIAHNGDVDTSAIHDFLKRAPNIIRRLIQKMNADDNLYWKHKPDSVIGEG